MQPSEKDIEQGLIEKHRKLNPSATRQSLNAFLDKPAYKIRQKDILTNELNLFGSMIAKISDQQFDKLLTELNDDKATVLLGYLHRFMDYITLEKGESSGNALKFQDKIINAFGKGILFKAGFRSECMVNRNSTSFQLAI